MWLNQILADVTGAKTHSDILRMKILVYQLFRDILIVSYISGYVFKVF